MSELLREPVFLGIAGLVIFLVVLGARSGRRRRGAGARGGDGAFPYGVSDAGSQGECDNGGDSGGGGD